MLLSSRRLACQPVVYSTIRDSEPSVLRRPLLLLATGSTAPPYSLWAHDPKPSHAARMHASSSHGRHRRLRRSASRQSNQFDERTKREWRGALGSRCLVRKSDIAALFLSAVLAA